MTKMTGAASAAIIVGLLLHSGAAGAVTRTWVSGSGDDSNPCTRDFPCATFSQAYNLTDAGGEIDVVDGGDFGAILISKAITIANDGAGVAAITPVGGNVGIGVVVGSTDTVVLRGLSINGTRSSDFGVSVVSGGSVLIDHCKIQNFQGVPGLVIAPNSASSPAVWVKDTTLVGDGGGTFGSAAWIAPSTQGGANVHLEHVQILNSTGNAIRADCTFQGCAGIDLELHDVMVDGSTGGSGIAAVTPTSGGAAITIFADDVTVSHSAGYGLRAVGGTASITLSRSVIEDNDVGISVSSGGRIFSYRDNRFSGNTAGDGVPPNPASLK